MIGNDWDNELKIIWDSPGFHKFWDIVMHEYATKDIFPEKENIFNALKLTPYSKVKVVIVGQDPYHGVGEAHGLSFSVQKGVKLPPSLKNIYKDDKTRLPIIKYFKEFMENYNNEEKPLGIYLTGSFGSGKTYMIAALFNELAKKNVRSALIYYPEFLRSLKSSFQTNYNEKFNYIKKVPLLLLDDIGAENCSAWSRDEVLGPILQYRMESHLPTFFTSNLTMEELESALAVTNSSSDKVKARRIIERIKQLTITLELVSKNRRK